MLVYEQYSSLATKDIGVAHKDRPGDSMTLGGNVYLGSVIVRHMTNDRYGSGSL